MCECVDYSDGSRYQCPVCAGMTNEQVARLLAAEKLVQEQAADVALWLVLRPPRECSVAHLQESLRLLHKTVEGKMNNPLLEDPW